MMTLLNTQIFADAAPHHLLVVSSVPDMRFCYNSRDWERAMKQPVQRRLAAILAADVAGYTRLMGVDEEGTLERLKALRRELLDPKIAAHHGRIVKTSGDGMLVEFDLKSPAPHSDSTERRGRGWQTRASIQAWLPKVDARTGKYLFPSRFQAHPHLSTRLYARIVHAWVESAGLDGSAYGTHSMRRTKAAQIYKKTGNLRAVQLLLGHTKLESTARYLGIEVDDALSISEQVEL
jgi:class 3 adenylate cyclase